MPASCTRAEPLIGFQHAGFNRVAGAARGERRSRRPAAAAGPGRTARRGEQPPRHRPARRGRRGLGSGHLAGAAPHRLRPHRGLGRDAEVGSREHAVHPGRRHQCRRPPPADRRRCHRRPRSTSRCRRRSRSMACTRAAAGAAADRDDVGAGEAVRYRRRRARPRSTTCWPSCARGADPSGRPLPRPLECAQSAGRTVRQPPVRTAVEQRAHRSRGHHLRRGPWRWRTAPATTTRPGRSRT